MVRKLTAFAPLCAIILSLTACGAQEHGGTIHINERPKEAVTLSMFVPVGADLGGVDSFRDLTLDYNELHGNIKITLDSVSTADGFNDFLMERLDTEDAVDVFVVNAENVKDIDRKGQFYDLSGLDAFQALTESAREQAVVDGTTYCIPLKMAIYILEVNVSMLERHGLEVPENYEEFLNCCRVLKEAGVTPIALNRWWAMAVPVMARSLYPIYRSESREELIEGLNSGTLNIGDYMLVGFRMFEEFLDKGYYGEDLNVEEVDAIKANTQDKEDFLNARVAFRFRPIEDLNATVMENGDVCMPVGIPMLPDGAITLPSISVRLSANKGSSHLQETLDFVDYLASRRVELLAEDKAGSLSPFLSGVSPEMEEPWQQSVLEMLDAGGQIPLEDMNLHFSIWDNTRKLCLSMVGGMSAEEAAEEYNRMQAEELRAYAEADRS